MPIQINPENGGKICLVQVSSELVSDFRGWDAGALWQELKVDTQHFGDIERLACLGDRHWQRWLTEFCVPFTKASVHYFDCANAGAARKWLGES